MLTNIKPVEKATFDERERAVVEHARFFKAYKRELKGLFEALERENEWSDDPQQMLPYLREKWIGIEHGNHFTKDQFTDEQVVAARPWLHALGLTMAQRPRRNAHFDQVVIGGGTMITNYRRVGFVDELIDMGVKIDKLVFWLGRRPATDRDGTAQELLSPTGKLAGESVKRNPWVQDLIKRGALKTPGALKLTETDLGRVAVLKIFDGKMMPYRVDLSALNEKHRRADLLDSIERMPEEYVTDYYFRTDEGLEIALLNGKSVSRGIDSDGKPRPRRPTTASTTKEWLERHSPPENAKILYVTGNPHMLRMAEDTYAVMRQMGRDDIELSIAGIEPYEGMDIHIYLGEIARLIDNDVRRNYVS